MLGSLDLNSARKSEQMKNFYGIIYTYIYLLNTKIRLTILYCCWVPLSYLNFFLFAVRDLVLLIAMETTVKMFILMLLLSLNRLVFKDRQARRGHQEPPEPPEHPEALERLDHPEKEGVLDPHVDGSSVLGHMGQARRARTLVLFM